MIFNEIKCHVNTFLTFLGLVWGCMGMHASSHTYARRTPMLDSHTFYARLSYSHTFYARLSYSTRH